MHKKRPASTYLQEIRANQEVEGWCDMHFMYVFWPAPEFTFIIGSRRAAVGIRILGPHIRVCGRSYAPGGSFCVSCGQYLGHLGGCEIDLLAFALCMDGVHSIWKYSRKGKGEGIRKKV